MAATGPGGKTPLRSARIPDAVWFAAKERAEREGTTITSVIVAALEAYGGRNDGEGSDR